MPDNVYEVLAQGARYWFLFWMVLIAWRSWRWYRKDRRAAKKRLKLLPDAGFIGEMVVVSGGGRLPAGTVFTVPREGTLGSLRTNDLCVHADGVERRHLWFRFDDRQGLMVEPFGKNPVQVDGEAFISRRQPLYMGHGSLLTAGGVQLRLRLFAGFESVGHAARRESAGPQQPPNQQAPQISPEQYAMMQQAMFQQWQMQQAYQQGYQQAMARQQAARPEAYEEPAYEDPRPEWEAEEDESLPFDMAQIAREEGLVDNSVYMRPAGQARPELPVHEEQPVFYPPEMDDDPTADEEDWILEADDELPRSAYVEKDEAEIVKREVWDKYFGGGARK